MYTSISKVQKIMALTTSYCTRTTGAAEWLWGTKRCKSSGIRVYSPNCALLYHTQRKQCTSRGNTSEENNWLMTGGGAQRPLISKAVIFCTGSARLYATWRSSYVVFRVPSTAWMVKITNVYEFEMEVWVGVIAGESTTPTLGWYHKE